MTASPIRHTAAIHRPGLINDLQKPRPAPHAIVRFRILSPTRHSFAEYSSFAIPCECRSCSSELSWFSIPFEVVSGRSRRVMPSSNLRSLLCYVDQYQPVDRCWDQVGFHLELVPELEVGDLWFTAADCCHGFFITIGLAGLLECE